MKKITVSLATLLERLEEARLKKMDFVELDFVDGQLDFGIRNPAFLNISGIRKTTDEYIVDFGSVDEITPQDLAVDSGNGLPVVHKRAKKRRAGETARALFGGLSAELVQEVGKNPDMQHFVEGEPVENGGRHWVRQGVGCLAVKFGRPLFVGDVACQDGAQILIVADHTAVPANAAAVLIAAVFGIPAERRHQTAEDVQVVHFHPRDTGDTSGELGLPGGENPGLVLVGGDGAQLAF